MATLVLSAAGAALGSGFGGTVMGLSGAVIGRALGATVGRAIDQRLMGAGSSAVEIGRVDRFRLMSAGEGQPVARLWGRMRVGGHVIWCSPFEESVTRQRSGKGGARQTTESYSYSVSLAVALCEGEILRLGRIWADGSEIDPDGLTLRLYTGSEEQLPDAKMEAVEGAGRVPAYRGIAYVVIEDLGLERFGNRVPQFSFEVMRAAEGGEPGLSEVVRAVAMMPGTGEYTLATTRVSESHGPGEGRVLNGNALTSGSDFTLALDQLREELPGCGAVSLVVSWFGDDLRCGTCQVQPMVEQREFEGEPLNWKAGGIARAEAEVVPRQDGRPIYGGTPADASVIEAIAALHEAGQAVMFYPFVLMTQQAFNGRPDPWSGAEHQPVLPWRGRITLSQAPGTEGSPDRSAAAQAQVAAFFGAAEPGDFTRSGKEVSYHGPAQDWGYRRFILHYAHLCAAGGGASAFCIGSELRGLTTIRGAGDGFPAVTELRRLVADVRSILGSGCKISYAADWSEYAGYTSPEGDRYFHLDPLWSDPEVDFIGIDNYLPLSDWRDAPGHLDAGWGAIHNLDYLSANVAGGEYYDWYYDTPDAEAAQRRLPIEDAAHGEPWIWRQKDLFGWWSNPHHERIAGLRSETPTAWVPGMKPFWFTELGCAAVDKGTNQPNLFLDPKSSESFLPRASTGRRDDFIQMQYLRAMARHWGDPTRNPLSAVDGRRMVDLSRAFVWAWDARPYPQFPTQDDLWSDGDNHARGHWLSGRSTNQPLAEVIAEICRKAGVGAVDVSGVYGVVRGMLLSEGETARAALQSLCLAYGVDVAERDGVLRFFMRGDTRVEERLGGAGMALHSEVQGAPELIRASEAETVGRLRLGFVEAEGEFTQRLEEASSPDAQAVTVSDNALPMLLTAGEARGIAERWLAESRVAQDSARFALPPSKSWLGAGDLVELEGAGQFRIDRLEEDGVILVEATRIEPSVYAPSDAAETRVLARPIQAEGPILPVFLDLPLMSETQDPLAPHFAATSLPWNGAVALWSADEDAGYELNRLISTPTVMGVTTTPLEHAAPGRWDRGAALRVRLLRGSFASASRLRVFNGANAIAIGDGSPGAWEILQFAEAESVGPSEWALSMRLRGQLGTDALMPERWPVGSLVVVLDPMPLQIAHPASRRGLARHYRIGRAHRGLTYSGVRHQVETFACNGLRPLSPVHLRVRKEAGGHRVSWVRRGRIDADSWLGSEIPLGEEGESYRVRILAGPELRREIVVFGAGWFYSEVERLADGIVGGWSIDVAQLSERFGPGPSARLDIGV